MATADSNSLASLLERETAVLSDNCDTSCIPGTTSLTTTQIEARTEQLEDIMVSLNEALLEKEEVLNVEVESKLDVVRNNKDSLLSTKNAIRNMEMNQSYTLQLEKYNLQNSLKQLKYLQRDIDQKESLLCAAKKKLKKKKTDYCKQSKRLLDLLESMAVEKQAVLDDMAVTLDAIDPGDSNVETDDCGCD